MAVGHHSPEIERELLQLVAEGDQQAFTTLVRQYRGNVYATALKLLHIPVLAEEVLQDVFLKVWLQRQELHEIENFPAWLHGVAKNTIYTAFRRSLRHKPAPIGDTHDEVADYVTADQQLLEKEYNLLLHKAIERLPPRQRETYRLVRQQGLKRTEVAEMMDISSETVKYHLDEATRKVRAYCLAQLPLGALLLLLNIR